MELDIDIVAETWKPVPGYEGHYEVSDDGRIVGTKYARKRALNPYANRNGTLMVSLYREGVRSVYSVQTVVAMAWLPVPEVPSQAHHKSTDLSDNRPSNIYWKPVRS